MQSRISGSFILGLAGALAAANSHEVLANAAPAAIAIKAPPNATQIRHTIDENRVDELIRLSAANDFTPIANWFKSHEKELAEFLTSVNNPNNLKASLKAKGFPADPFDDSRAKDIAELLKEPAVQPIISKLQDLDPEERARLQNLAKNWLEATDKTLMDKKIIAALKEAGIDINHTNFINVGKWVAILSTVLLLGGAAGHLIYNRDKSNNLPIKKKPLISLWKRVPKPEKTLERIELLGPDGKLKS